MEDKTIIQILRTVSGVVLLITHAITHVDGSLILAAMILMGIPFEYLKRSNNG